MSFKKQINNRANNLVANKTSYGEIVKSTFLFSFVRVFQILIGIIRNKVIAVLLGAEGVGIIGILTNTIQLLQTGTGLGISQSAVRDIAEANEKDDTVRFSRIIVITNTVIRFTFLLGCVVTIIFAPLLSKWTFGDYSYTAAYIWISIVVALNTLTEGQLAILKGMRKLKSVAKASVIGSALGLIFGLPLYYFFGKDGIIPAFIVSSLSAILLSFYYVRKIPYERVHISLKDVSKESTPMLKMGIALMLVGFLHLLFDLIIVAYVRSSGGLEMVGIYRAGTIIITSYFGVVLTAMTTDYYPRISAVHDNNEILQTELNRQSTVGLLLIFPISILFVLLSPVLTRILYSADFDNAVLYTDYAIIGTILVVCSDSMGMILLAKQTALLFTVHAFLHRLIFIPVYIVMYKHAGLAGLGYAYAFNVLLQFIFYMIINRMRYKIRFSKHIYIFLAVILITVLFTIQIRRIETTLIMYLAGIGLFLFSLLYVYIITKRDLKFDLINMLKSKLFNKK